MAAGETKPRAPLRTSLPLSLPSLLGRVRPPNLRGERERSRVRGRRRPLDQGVWLTSGSL